MFTSSESRNLNHVMIDKLSKLHKYVRLIYSWKVLVCNDNIAHNPNIWKLFACFSASRIPYTYIQGYRCKNVVNKNKFQILPSSYSGGASRSIVDSALPHVVCNKLLQVPSKVLYLFSKHTGSWGHVSSRKLSRVSIPCNPNAACSGESDNLVYKTPRIRKRIGL